MLNMLTWKDWLYVIVGVVALGWRRPIAKACSQWIRTHRPKENVQERAVEFGMIGLGAGLLLIVVGKLLGLGYPE